MKILVLNGSPKGDASDTMHITRAFLQGMADAAPQEVRILHVIRQHIEYCTGCFACMRNGGTCRHHDDMKEILETILAQFRRMFPHDRTILTVPESPMFNAPEAASVTVPRLALVREAGRLYARTAAIPPELLTQITSPMIPEETYAQIVNTTA